MLDLPSASIHNLANWMSTGMWFASAVLWLIAAWIRIPTLVGSMHEIGPGGIGALSKNLKSQSRWNFIAAIASALGALSLAVAGITS